MIAPAESIRVMSLISGRARLHLSNWNGDDADRIEKRLRQISGIESVQANSRTGNCLIRFDRKATDEKMLLRDLHAAWSSLGMCKESGATNGKLADPHSAAIRVGVRGLLGHAILDSLWFGAGFLGNAIGLPLAGLGPLHVLMDIVVWTIALRSGTRSTHCQVLNTESGCAPQVGPRIPVTSQALRTPVDAASV